MKFLVHKEENVNITVMHSMFMARDYALFPVDLMAVSLT